MRINDQSFDSNPPASWEEIGEAVSSWDEYPDHELLIGWVPGYREEVFIRVVTDGFRPDAVRMSDAGFGSLSTSDLMDLIRQLIQGDVSPGQFISVDSVD